MSSLEERRYRRQEAAKMDKSQTVFSPEGLKPNPITRVIKVMDTVLPLMKKVTCPFCLGLSPFRQYLVSTKKGISKSVGKCPLCDQGMFLKTLVGMDSWTATQYAGWVQPYSRNGFWKKVNFEVWKRRLQLMGWTQEFWDRYKELKGDDGSEGYGDYMERKQREEHEAEMQEVS